MSEEKLIYKQIPKIMKEINAIGKDRNNASQGYKFRGIDDVYNELHTKLATYGVFTVPQCLEEKREDRQTKSGGALIYAILKMKYTFFAEDGSFVETIVIGEGMDSGDKASNKAMSVAHKYALMQLFAIPTLEDKDPENESPEPKPKALSKPAMQSQPKSIPPSDLGEYVVKFGKKLSGKKLKDIPERDLENYVFGYLEKGSIEKSQPLTGDALELFTIASQYLESVNLKLNDTGTIN